jgi:DNA-binding MarR family transcriptional regulator
MTIRTKNAKARTAPRTPARNKVKAASRTSNVAVRSRAATTNGQAEIKLGPLAEWIGFHLRLAQAASFQAFAREARNLDLPRPGWFATLLLIGENPGITQTRLSLANGCDKSTLTPVLRLLARRGLVRRVQASHDRRNFHLSLTEAGKKTLRDLLGCARRHERNIDRIIGKNERDIFLNVLRKLLARL